jgi:hypothetical protein
MDNREIFYYLKEMIITVYSGWIISGFASILYHKVRKQNSFRITNKARKIYGFTAENDVKDLWKTISDFLGLKVKI